jgi:hypothetical protein
LRVEICVAFPTCDLRKNYLTGTEEEREIGEKKGIFKSYKGNKASQNIFPQCWQLTLGIC